MKLYYYSTELGIEERYKEFLKAYYKERYDAKWARLQWYSKLDGFHVLLAEIDGKLVGQSCAYPCKLSLGGQIRKIFWGVDNFVLEEHRGKGVGKALQKKLHEDHEGFSSTSYSGVNSHIKKKLGDRSISTTNFYYYPVSTFFTLFLSLGVSKLFNKNMDIIRLSNCYAKSQFSKGISFEAAQNWGGYKI